MMVRYHTLLFKCNVRHYAEELSALCCNAFALWILQLTCSVVATGVQAGPHHFVIRTLFCHSTTIFLHHLGMIPRLTT